MIHGHYHGPQPRQTKPGHYVLGGVTECYSYKFAALNSYTAESVAEAIDPSVEFPVRDVTLTVNDGEFVGAQAPVHANYIYDIH